MKKNILSSFISVVLILLFTWLGANIWNCDRTHTEPEFAKIVAERFLTTKVTRVSLLSSRPGFPGYTTRWNITGAEGQKLAEVTIEGFLGLGLQMMKFESFDPPKEKPANAK